MALAKVRRPTSCRWMPWIRFGRKLPVNLSRKPFILMKLHPVRMACFWRTSLASICGSPSGTKAEICCLAFRNFLKYSTCIFHVFSRIVCGDIPRRESLNPTLKTMSVTSSGLSKVGILSQLSVSIASLIVKHSTRSIFAPGLSCSSFNSLPFES